MFTTGPQWPNKARLGALLGLLPYSTPKTAHKGTQALVWFLPFFPPAFLLWQSRQILLQLAVYCLVNGAVAVAHQACLSTHLAGFYVDELHFLQLPYVLGNGVVTHAGVLADPPDAGPALVGFPILAEHQVGVDRQLAMGKPQGENLIEQKKVMAQ